MQKEDKERLLAVSCIMVLLIVLGVLGWAQPFHSGKEYYDFFEYTSNYPATKDVSLWVNEYQIDLNTYEDGKLYSTGWLTTEYDTTFTVGDFEGYEVTINGQPIQSGESISIPIPQIERDVFITVVFRNIMTDEERQTLISTLPLDFPDLNVLQYETVGKDSLCFTAGNFLVKVKPDGSICYYRGSRGAIDFQQYQINDTIRYSFLENTGEYIAGDERFPAYKAVLMNEQYELLEIIEKVDTKSGLMPLTKYGFQYLADGDYVLASVIPQTVFNIPQDIPHNTAGVRLMSVWMSRVTHGETQWSWNGAENSALFYELRGTPDLFNRENIYEDYFRLSDLERVNGRLACSFRGLDSIIMLDLKNGQEVNQIEIGESDIIGELAHLFQTDTNSLLCFFDGQTPQLFAIDSQDIEQIDIGIQATACDGGSVVEKDGKYYCAWGNTEGKGALLSVLKNEPQGPHLSMDILGTYDEEAPIIIDRIYPAA